MSDIAEERMQNYIDELEQENRLLRARNDRLEKEIFDWQNKGCKFPLCQTEDYQKDLAEQIKRELYTGQPAPVQEPSGHFIDFAYTYSIAQVYVYDQFKEGQEFYASPPASKPWVGLDDKDYRELHLQIGPAYFYQDYGRAIEALLKEKNT